MSCQVWGAMNCGCDAMGVGLLVMAMVFLPALWWLSRRCMRRLSR